MSRTYRIGQVARKLDVNTSVLRYWETEFPQIHPIRTRSGQRLYTEEHIKTLRMIQYLVYDEGLTIEGARKRLRERSQLQPIKEKIDAEQSAHVQTRALKLQIIDELLDMKRILEGKK
ncbi:MerR family transcriptional regulator [Desulfobaculum bizertense]|uniref:DNA-binding transcriptional regulator, MerR family n=1 Tax=Desulfobaculum bizertense DSM 18034 TaxID=1121442 RepID=A0A1T4X2G8_9BACT|nr:MerR family transcriptional regulator [Desulfobaculum bizertense]UIJ37320.1 MerR family transcriptional regulator [Desulfobaculum bizertense]SKA83833.1 DNA-binding transcriptional regulator, MerR family [Desulfobaculum bizertense DSM 18034]